jgi:hypothetical protein
MKSITTVSTGIRKDLPVWELTQSTLLENFPDAEVNLIVPKSDYFEFKKITKNKVKLHIEDEILDCQYLRTSSNSKKFNWYYQQFLKIYFFKDSKTEFGIIWDADTPLLKFIDIISKDSIIINTGIEPKHPPYCRTIEHLLGITSYQDLSFISQFIAFKIDHLKNFILTLESADKDWLSKIVNSDDVNNLIFSEYETLAAFFLLKYPDQYKVSSLKWEREGGKKINRLKNIDLNHLRSIFPADYYVALESYDVLGSLSVIERIKYRFLMGKLTSRNAFKYIERKLGS